MEPARYEPPKPRKPKDKDRVFLAYCVIGIAVILVAHFVATMISFSGK